MDLQNFVSHNSKTKEEKEKILQEFIKSAEKNGIKSLSPEEKKAKVKAYSIAHPGEKTTITIPDINTFFGYSQMAVSLLNKASGPIYYWYTYNGLEKWYYKHTIGKNASTWDWQWSDYYTHHCMIIEIPIHDGSGDSWFFVPAIVKYDAGPFVQPDVPRVNVYYARARSDHPPRFDHPVWIILYEDLYPDIKKMDLFNFHVKITCYDTVIDWDGHIL